jgi:N-acetylglucosaminyl-diphospho-decaprenol L-rhamnosyltransferase
MTSVGFRGGTDKPVAICIVSHWHRELLRRCLESLLRDDAAVPIRVVVLDNCSGDGSAEMVQDDFPGVELLKGDVPRGFAANQNRMLRREVARSSYVMMLNDDTIVKPGCLAGLLSLMEEEPSAGAVGAQLEWPDGRLQSSAAAFPSVWKEVWRLSGLGRLLHSDRLKRWLARNAPGWAPREIREHLAQWSGAQPRQTDVLCGGAMLIRSSALRQVGLLDERYVIYVEDVDWCRRAARAGWARWIVPSARVLHYGSASQGLFSRVEWERGTIRYFAQYHGERAANVFRLSLACAAVARLVLTPAAWALRGRERAAAQWAAGVALFRVAAAPIPQAANAESPSQMQLTRD